MLRQKYFSRLNFICLICSCKCQDLEKFVAPLLDNRGAPLVAIVNTTNISSHIVRSIEMPLREIINSTIECKINDKLKEDIVSSQVLQNVNDQMDTLQQTIDKHIGDNRGKFTEVKQEIAALRKEMEETILRRRIEQMKNLTKMVDTVNTDLNEKVKKLAINVDIMQSELKETILSIDRNVSNLASHLENYSNRLNELRLNLQKLVVKTSAIENDMGQVKALTDINDESLRGHDSKLDSLTETINDMNSRVLLCACASRTYTYSSGQVIKFGSIQVSNGITGLASFKTSGIFICEKKGHYLISFFITSKNPYASMTIFKNNSNIGRATKHGTSEYQTHTVIVLSNLNVGDTISVKADASTFDVWSCGDSYFSMLQVS